MCKKVNKNVFNYFLDSETKRPLPGSKIPLRKSWDYKIFVAAQFSQGGLTLLFSNVRL